MNTIVMNPFMDFVAMIIAVILLIVILFFVIVLPLIVMGWFTEELWAELFHKKV